MKYGYTVLLALVALVAFTGFAAADRLPSEVPENQIFSIDTLIDVTGAVTDQSEMQWTIDNMNRKYQRSILKGAANNTGYVYIPDGSIDSFKTAVAAAGGTLDGYLDADGDYVITRLDVPDDKLTTLIGLTSGDWRDWTWQRILNLMKDTNAYAQDSYTDLGHIDNKILQPSEEIAIVTYKDTIQTNGGKLSLNKNIDFDSQDKAKGLNNLEASKVLTYASTEGAHLVGSELWNLDVAGNWDQTADNIRCVFATAKSEIWPAFCNAVQAKSELVNINSAQISTKGSIRAVAASGDSPAELNYQIAVTPDSNSGSGFAEGTVKTEFGGSIMEARGKNQAPSVTNNFKDKTEVTGGIKNFQKTFAYVSGFRI